MSILWAKASDGFRAEVGDVTLCAVPVHMKFGKPARGTEWRACVSSWEAATRTISRFGRDVYDQKVKTAKDAMRLAETVYREATVSA